jgi:hypothetical protein
MTLVLTGPLRVFVSSTMKDLVNERAQVCQRLLYFNFAPVNAENLVPDGTRTWERLRSEIRASDLFVLIVGERYGFVPESGPMSEANKSATELELDEAIEAGIPVLVFIKRLDAGAPMRTKDARRRRDLLQRIDSWEHGRTSTWRAISPTRWAARLWGWSPTTFGQLR